MTANVKRSAIVEMEKSMRRIVASFRVLGFRRGVVA
jgi:hypothetical protein